MSRRDVIPTLTAALAALPEDTLVTPEADRVGAALVIVEPRDDGETTIVYTRRRDDLRSHPGQISFPGGRVDPGETVEQAAVREANEEVGLDPAGVELLGRLPAFYIPPSRFWLQAVVAYWRDPHALRAAEAEVAAVLHVPLSRLRSEEARRVVRLSSAGWSWAWDLGDGHLLWGATAILTTVILGLVDPGWNAGAAPADFAHREVRPWERELRAVDLRRAARIPAAAQIAAEALAQGAPAPASVTPDRRDRAAEAIADAVMAVAPEGAVTVLVGTGGTGAVGEVAARKLRELGRSVEVSTPDGVTPEALSRAAVIVDALLGSGFQPPLRGAPARVISALRMHFKPVVSVDLPSGLDRTGGLVGEVVTADVTVALGGVAPGLLLPGLAPFVGDLYVTTFDDAPLLQRVVGTDPAGTWRE